MKRGWMNGVLDWKMKEEKEGDGRRLRAPAKDRLSLFNAQSI